MPPVRSLTAPLPVLEQALADAVAEAKTGNPLAPVTVLVGGTLLRPYLQRRVAALLGGHANVDFVTAGELALRLGEPSVIAAGRLPMPPLASRILAGEVARETDGYFQPVAHTTGFTVALHRLLRELIQAGVDAATFATFGPTLPGTPAKHAALAELYSGYEERRAGWYGVDECLQAADPLQFTSELLVLYGVWDLSAGLQQALTAVAEHAPTLLLLPSATGDAANAGLTTVHQWRDETGAVTAEAPADPRPATLLRHVQDHVLAEVVPSSPPPPDDTLHLVSSPDPSREVRAAARACLTWAAEGIPFHRMAIAYRHADTYRPLVDAEFRAAGIPVYLHEGTPLSEMPLGRRILSVLDLIDAGLERRAVIDTLSDASMPKETRERYPGFSATRWDILSREAGIVAGLDEWQNRLAQTRTDQVARIAAASDPSPWMEDGLQRIDSLIAFITDLASALDERPLHAPFGAHLAYLEQLLRTYVEGAEPVLVALSSLARLDGLTDSLSFDRFRDLVRAAVDGMRSDEVQGGRAGAFGRRGVNVLDVNSLRHLRFEGVALLGLVERSWPSPVRQDPLLLDRERVALQEETGRTVPLRTLGGDPEPLQFVVAVQAAERRLQASYARSDRAGGRAQLPSSFLRGLAAAATGRDVTVAGFEELDSGLFRRERAAQAGAPSGQAPLSETERIRSALEDEETAPLARALLHRNPRMARATTVDLARASRRLTEFDGGLLPESIPILAAQWALTRPMPPTALEKYASCGMQFFLERVLSVRVVDEPEAELTINPLTKGSIVHDTLEEFLVELGDDDWPRPERRAEHLPRLLAIGERHCDDAEQRGLTGAPLLWMHDRRRLLEDLVRWYDAEAERGRDLPLRSYELRIGPLRRGEEDTNPRSTDEPLTKTFGGHTLSFQGRIDRVEWDPATGQFRVIDYKTGRPWKKGGDIDGGEALQLPLYVEEAAHALDLNVEDGEAEYFYVTRDGGFVRTAFTREDLAEQRDTIDAAVQTLVEGVTTGVYAARPKQPRVCERCAFDALCDSRRMAQAARKNDDARLAGLRQLREGDA